MAYHKSVSILASLHEPLKAEAERQGRTISSIIEKLVARWLDEQKPAEGQTEEFRA